MIATSTLNHSLAFPLRYLVPTFVSHSIHKNGVNMSFFNQWKLPPRPPNLVSTEPQSKVNFKVVFLVLSTPWRRKVGLEHDDLPNLAKTIT